MANDELILGAEFPPAGRADWLALVDKVLDGAPFDRKLVSTTYDGLRIEPLYTRDDGPPADAAGRPGAPPYLRGRRAAANVADGWDVRQYHAGTDLEALNRAILTDLERGVTSIVLGPSGITDLDGLDRALAGVYLDIAPISLDWGPDAGRGAALLRALWERRGVPASAAVGELGLDPLGVLARHGWLAGTVEHELAELGRVAAEVAASCPDVVTARVDATVYADAGAADASEVAAALATGVAYLRALVDAGLGIDDALGQIAFRLTASADQFATIAKLRAARRCWARVAAASGASAAAPAGMTIHAVTATAMYAQRDPWVNVLRATLACFAAAAGGADAITVLPLGAAAGVWDDAGLRLARNTQIILAEESGLTRVADPAGGSWYVERRSDEVAAEAWRRFQAIEAAGGMAASLQSGAVAAEIGATWQARLANLARRKDAITGVSEFPDLDADTPPSFEQASAPAPADAATRIEALPLRRHAAPFEALRDRADRLAAEGTRPAVFLANLGPVATHTARATFAKNFFEVGGIRALGNDGFAAPAEAAAAFTASGAGRAVICSSDAVYAELAGPTATALKAAGCATVYLAGNPGEAREAYLAAGVDEFVYIGCDLLDILDRALG